MNSTQEYESVLLRVSGVAWLCVSFVFLNINIFKVILISQKTLEVNVLEVIIVWLSTELSI